MSGKKVLLKKVHLILLIILLAMSVGYALQIISAFVSGYDASACSTPKQAMRYALCLNVTDILACICGIFYHAQDYSNDASLLYKTFMMLCTLSAFFNLLFSVSCRGQTPVLLLFLIKIIVLAIMAFGENPGKKNRRILFILLQNFIAPQLLFVISKLIMDGTIGLSLMAKYSDKAAPGHELISFKISIVSKNPDF